MIGGTAPEIMMTSILMKTTEESRCHQQKKQAFTKLSTTRTQDCKDRPFVIMANNIAMAFYITAAVAATQLVACVNTLNTIITWEGDGCLTEFKEKYTILACNQKFRSD